MALPIGDPFYGLSPARYDCVVTVADSSGRQVSATFYLAKRDAAGAVIASGTDGSVVGVLEFAYSVDGLTTTITRTS